MLDSGWLFDAVRREKPAGPPRGHHERFRLVFDLAAIAYLLPAPAGSVIVGRRPVIIARSVITAIIVGPTMIIGAAIIWTGIVPTIVGVIVTEVIEYKRERKRDSETDAIGASWQRGDDQRGNKEQKNQRLFHLTCTSGESLQLTRNQMKREARRERHRARSSGIERDRAASSEIERHRTGPNGIERHRAGSPERKRDGDTASGRHDDGMGQNETLLIRI
jgi:hypothetical protein